VRAAWDPESHLETLVSDALSGSDEQVARIVSDTALLLACTGFPAESDRLAVAWAAHHTVPLPDVARHGLSHRAWAMLWNARDRRPDWAGAVPPLDIDAEERAHSKRLERDRPPPGDRETAEVAGIGMVRPGGTESGGGASIPALEALERLVSGAEPSGGRSRDSSALLAAELAAAGGRPDRALELLDSITADAVESGRLPDLRAMASCRNIAVLLVRGALADRLGVDADWGRRCAGELRAVLDTRSGGRPGSADTGPRELGWAELVDAVLAARSGPDLPVAAAPPAATAEQVRVCEARLGVRLPPDHREFLLTADGLPGDITFPELLGTGSLTTLSTVSIPDDLDVGPIRRAVPAGAVERVVRVSAPTGAAVLLLVPGTADGWQAWEFDPALGYTVHPTFRRLLESHLHLLRGIA